MSDSPVSAARLVGLRGPLAAVPVLVACLLILGWIFRAEASAAEDVWQASAAYAHCFAVVPIAAWLVWERRHTAAALTPRPSLRLALFALPVSAVWLLASLAGLMEGRQLAALATGEVLAAAVLGGALFRVLSVPLLFLFFLVPTGAFLTPMLQDFTARFMADGLDLIGIPYVAQSNIIEIPEGVFIVADACAGLRFLTASVMFGTLYAFTIYRSPVRRGLFVAASIIVPILANGARALGLVLIGHALGSARSVAVDHLLYGWLFFSLITLLLVVGGLPFREDTGPVGGGQPQPMPRETGERAWITGASVVAMACMGPVLAGLLPTATAGVQESAAAARVLDGVRPAADCHATGLDGTHRGFSCLGAQLTVSVQVLPRRANPADLAAEAHAAFAGLERAPSPPGTMDGWEIAGDGRQIVALGVWVNGKLLGSGLAGRLEQARVVVAGGRNAPILIVVRAVADPGQTEPSSILQAFIAAQGELAAVIEREASAVAKDKLERSEPS